MSSNPLSVLAPVVAVETLVELAVGTAAVAWLIDLLGHVGRGFRGSTAVICLLLAATSWWLLGGVPAPHEVLAGGSDTSLNLLHGWMVALLIALAVDVVFAVVGTDAARHVVGGLVLVPATAVIVTMSAAFAPVAGAAAGIASAGAASVLCGSALAGMLLGHWYLIQPSLSFKPLRQATYIIAAAVLCFGAVVIAAVAIAAPGARDRVISGDVAVLFWLLVVGSGVVFTAAVDGLTLHFARIRANQPATAMLYVLIVTTLMGAVPASLVFLSTGVAV